MVPQWCHHFCIVVTTSCRYLKGAGWEGRAVLTSHQHTQVLVFLTLVVLCQLL